MYSIAYHKNCLAVFLFLFAASCNPANKVMKNQEQFDKVGRKWLEANPCVTDSAVIYLPGKRDSIPFEVPVYIKDDDYSVVALLDSIRRAADYIDNACAPRVLAAYKKGYERGRADVTKQLSQVKIPLPVIDTFRITMKDKQQLRLLQSDLEKARKIMADSNVAIEKYKGSKTKWFLLFLLAVILLIISIHYNIKNHGISTRRS
jgi:hypothetical protein